LPFSLALSDQLNGNEIEIAVTFGTQQSYKQTDKIKTMPNERAELGGTTTILLSSWLRIWIYHTNHIYMGRIRGRTQCGCVQLLKWLPVS